jgi:addiction module RelE/StbE family toxin
MKVVFAPDAQADLLDILEFIARENPRMAGRFVRELRDAAIAIAEHPRAWPLIPRYEAKGYRRRIYRGYLLIYEVSGAEVRVLRVLNGAQDYERILFPQDDAT